MHVALFSPAWPPERFQNGIVTYVKWLRQALMAAGHSVSVFTPVLDADQAGIYRVRQSLGDRASNWLRALIAPVTFEESDWGGTIGRAIRAVHQVHPIDVVEMEESFGWMADVQRITQLPLVVKLHGPAFMSIVEEDLTTPGAKIRIAREGEALRRVSVITSPADRTLQDTIARYELRPPLAVHLPNPLRLPESAPLWNLESCDRRTILFVGRFDKRKGGDLVLRAFAQLLSCWPDLKLLFVGPDFGVPGADGRTVHFSEAKHSLFPGASADSVTYLGKLPPDKIYKLRTESLVTVSASRWENQSYATLEAMLQGCPTVSSDAGGQGEIIVDGVTGRLTRTGDADDLCLKLRSIVEDPAGAAQMGRRAREYVLATHAPKVVAVDTLGIYERAIEMAKVVGRPVRMSRDRSLGK
jgi:glycosyltransferase involved in cell wall biosynthesis